jgi:hypothetical protein
MTPYYKALHALGVPGGLTLEADGTYEILYLRAGYAPVLTDVGHEFETSLGANISHRETVVNPSWTNRVFSFDDKAVTDPNNGDTVTQQVLVKSGNGAGGAGGGGTAATNRLIAYESLAQPVTWDGTNDTMDVSASGAFRLGGA